MPPLDGIKLVECTEGRIRLLVPDLSYYGGEQREPAWAPVFYNPAMRVSRDISVAIVEAYARIEGRNSIRVCEPLCATGVRGLRYAAEVPAVSEVVLNDKNALAYQLALENAKLNGLANKVEVYNREARALLTSLAEEGRKFDVVDIDPFGSPAPFVEAALLSLKHKGLIMVTATDLAPLLGVKPRSCLRKYAARPLRSEFSKEVGARILAAFVVREAAKLGLAARPVYTFLSRHSLRLAAVVERSKSKAGKAVAKLGYVVYCPRCLFRRLESELPRERICPRCGGEVEVGGPLWVGELWDEKYAQSVLEAYSKREYASPEGLKLARLISFEATKPPLYTTVTSLAKLASMREEPSPAELVAKISQWGASASLTHFDPKGFRSSLQPGDVLRLLREGSL